MGIFSFLRGGKGLSRAREEQLRNEVYRLMGQRSNIERSTLSKGKWKAKIDQLTVRIRQLERELEQARR